MWVVVKRRDFRKLSAKKKAEKEEEETPLFLFPSLFSGEVII